MSGLGSSESEETFGAAAVSLDGWSSNACVSIKHGVIGEYIWIVRHAYKQGYSHLNRNFLGYLWSAISFNT